MERSDGQTRHRKIIIGLQVLRFAVAAVMFGLAIYFQDMVLGILAVAFLALGTYTTWLRLRHDRNDE